MWLRLYEWVRACVLMVWGDFESICFGLGFARMLGAGLDTRSRMAQVGFRACSGLLQAWLIVGSRLVWSGSEVGFGMVTVSFSAGLGLVYRVGKGKFRV